MAQTSWPRVTLVAVILAICLINTNAQGCVNPLSPSSICPDASKEIVPADLKLESSYFCLTRNVTVEGNLDVSNTSLVFYVTNRDLFTPAGQLVDCPFTNGSTAGFLTVLGNITVGANVSVYFDMYHSSPVITGKENIVVANSSVFETMDLFASLFTCVTPINSDYECEIAVLSISGEAISAESGNATSITKPNFTTSVNPGSLDWVSNARASVRNFEGHHIRVLFTDADTRTRFPFWAIGAIVTGSLFVLVLFIYVITRCCCSSDRAEEYSPLA